MGTTVLTVSTQHKGGMMFANLAGNIAGAIMAVTFVFGMIGMALSLTDESDG